MKLSIIFLSCIVAAFALPNSRSRPESSLPSAAFYKDIKVNDYADSRIINGKPATRGQFPYQVSVKWGILGTSSAVCGGSIITSNIVVTAAHCIQSLGTHHVVAGNLNRNENVEHTQSRDIERIFEHPRWPGGAVVSPYDIALLRLVSPLQWTTQVQPVQLPEKGVDFYGQAVLTGWGLTSTSIIATPPNTLQYAHKEIITNNECAATLDNLLGSHEPLDETMICTSGVKKISACNGDSGGPLAQDNTLVGIVSWGISPCGTLNAPTIFTSVSNYADWIKINL